MALVAKVGNIVKEDPVLRFSKDGKPITKFSIQVKPYVKDGPPPETVYYEVTCFGSLAEHVAECMKKGYRVIVSGEGKVETWTGKDGQEKSKKVIVANEIGPDLRFLTFFPGRADEPVAVNSYADESEAPF